MDVKTVLDDARDPAGPAYAGSLGLDGSDVAHVIEVANQAGLEVMTWTATSAQAARAAALGIDAVCVDDIPGTVRSVLDWRSRQRDPG